LTKTTTKERHASVGRANLNYRKWDISINRKGTVNGNN